MKTSFPFGIAALAIVGFAFPVSAAMTVLNDKDMDAITASGQPTVVISQNGRAEAADNSVQALNLVSNAQVGLRALAINNVVGEAQLLVNLNVISVAGDVAGVDQRNFGVQSWGSTMPLISVSEPGVPAVDNSVVQKDNNAKCTEKCAAPSVKGTGGTNVGVVNNAAAPVVDIASASGDTIVSGGKGAQYYDNSTAAINFEPNAQTDLAALFIANIAGRTQATFNVNIASSTLNLFPSTDQPFTLPSASSSAVMKQTNSGVQFRGTPINAAASIAVNQTP